MRTTRITLLFLVVFAITVTPQEKGGDDVTGPYNLAQLAPERLRRTATRVDRSAACSPKAPIASTSSSVAVSRS